MLSLIKGIFSCDNISLISQFTSSERYSKILLCLGIILFIILLLSRESINIISF